MDKTRKCLKVEAEFREELEDGTVSGECGWSLGARLGKEARFPLDAPERSALHPEVL